LPESFRENLQIRGMVYRSPTRETPAAEPIAVWRTNNHDPLVLKVEAELLRGDILAAKLAEVVLK
jgi:hypothetical protein